MFYVEEGEGPLVQLCHGFPEFWYSWRHQLTPLAEAGFRVVACDLPGYGRSDKPDVNYDVVWLTDCLAGLIKALGSERAVLCGHDWGGLLVWPFARLHPGRTAGVIGLNTPDLPRTPVPTTQYLAESGSNRTNYILEFQKPGHAEAMFENDLRSALEMFYKGPVCANPAVFTEEVMQAYIDAFAPEGAITPPLEYYRNIDRNWELLAQVEGRTIDVPCMMVMADRDFVLHPGLAEGMEQRDPNLKKVLIEDCGHWTQQEKPEETTRVMLDYLRSLEPWS